MARASTLRGLTDDQLLDELSNAKQELFNLRFGFVTGQMENSAQMTTVKRDIARINTVLREREIAAAELGEYVPRPTPKVKKFERVKAAETTQESAGDELAEAAEAEGDSQ